MVSGTLKPHCECQASSQLLAVTFFSLHPYCVENPAATLPHCSNILPLALSTPCLAPALLPTNLCPGLTESRSAVPSASRMQPCARGGLSGSPFWPSPFHPPLLVSTRGFITLLYVNLSPTPAIPIHGCYREFGFQEYFPPLFINILLYV